MAEWHKEDHWDGLHLVREDDWNNKLDIHNGALFIFHNDFLEFKFVPRSDLFKIEDIKSLIGDLTDGFKIFDLLANQQVPKVKEVTYWTVPYRQPTFEQQQAVWWLRDHPHSPFNSPVFRESFKKTGNFEYQLM